MLKKKKTERELKKKKKKKRGRPKDYSISLSSFGALFILIFIVFYRHFFFLNF